MSGRGFVSAYGVAHGVGLGSKVARLVQLHPPEALLRVCLICGHALECLDTRLCHFLGHIQVILISATHGIFHAQASEAVWAQAACRQVLLKYIHNMVKAKVLWSVAYIPLASVYLHATYWCIWVLNRKLASLFAKKFIYAVRMHSKLAPESTRDHVLICPHLDCGVCQVFPNLSRRSCRNRRALIHASHN